MNKYENLKLFPCEKCQESHFIWSEDGTVLICRNCGNVRHDKSLEQLEDAPFPFPKGSKILME